MAKTLDRQKQYDKAYMKMAEAFAALSHAKKKQVGAIIVSKDDQVIAQGFNGTPSGFNNICEEIRYSDGRVVCFDDNPEKFEELCAQIERGESDMSLVTKKIVLHAETNAIAKCAKYQNSTKGSTLYVTLSPCIDCAKLIIQAEISRVVYKEKSKYPECIQFLKECGIQVEML